MDSPPADILVMLIGFVIPLDIENAESGSDSDLSTSSTNAVAHDYRRRRREQKFVLLSEYAKKSSELAKARLSQIRSSLSWVASLRNTNRQWRALLDDDEESMWYHVASSLGLDPPRQLYSGGNYLDVCKCLLSAEDEKAEAQLQAEDINKGMQEHGVAACGMLMLRPPRLLADHPHPERPFVVLPSELMERVANNATDLENFLRSVNFSIVVKNNHKQGWAKSALNRYKMFLRLKKANPTVWLVPTVDIEFCWLAHIFRTENYWNDMTALGIDPSHSLCLTSYGEVATFSQAVRGTAALWEAEFGTRLPFLPEGADVSWKVWGVGGGSEAEVSRNDPRRFFPKMGQEILDIPSNVTLPNISLKMEDIEADLTWFPHLQEAFRELSSNAHDVMRGGDHDSLIEKQVLPSYERFLNLCCRQNVTNAAPPIVLDLVWYAHQMEPVRYRDECMELFNSEFRHHPWPGGLGVMSVLSQDFEYAWKEAYGTPIGDDWKFFVNRNLASS